MSELPHSTDIAIVGAGPSGLSLALALHERRATPLLLEKRQEIAGTSRAAVVHARTLEMLDALRVTPALLDKGIRIPVFRVRDRDAVLMKVDFSGLATRYPFTLMCPQDQTEAVLQERLLAAGGRVEQGADAIGIEPAETGAVLTVAAGGATQRIEAKWIIGCDGAHSIVREAAGIAFEGAAYAQVFALADVRMTWPVPRDEVSLFLSPAGLMVIAPLPGERFRIVATVAEAPEQPDAAFMEHILNERGPLGQAASIRDMLWSSRFHVAHRLAGQTVKGRTILCGDAAHVHSPAGGQGMNTGIQDAISLAEPLLEALHSGNPAGLEAWARTRRRIARSVVRTTDRMTRAATLQAPPARTLRNIALRLAGLAPGIPHLIARQLAELDRA